MRLIFIFFIVCIASCTRTTSNICRINGNEEYLHSAQLSRISIPNGMILPPLNDTYEIGNFPSPVSIVFDNSSVSIGKNLDICPPNVSY